MFKTIKYALYVLLFAGVFTACSDDDDLKVDTEVELTEQELAEMASADKFVAANSVIRALAEIDELPDNWENTTYEPSVGHVLDEANPDIRNVVSTSADDARAYFLSIVPDLGLEGDTWSHEEVGSLTFRAVNEKDCYAVMDVNLVQMPGLKQIRFVPKEVVGDNGFYGEPYYRAGDIVIDEDKNYWICIRPAGGPKGKDKAYFASFSTALIKYKEVTQNIYAYDEKGKLDKTKKLKNSGVWAYAKNLLEERMALAAAHTFAMLQIAEPKHHFQEQRKIMRDVDFDLDLFNTENPSDNKVFGCNIAYGSYESNKYTKVRQEKYLQPLMNVLYIKNKLGEGEISFTQRVEKVVLDSQANTTPYLLSLTTDYNPTAFDLLYKGKNIEGNPENPYDYFSYCGLFASFGFSFSKSEISYLKGYLNQNVLLMVQTCVKDHGKPHKGFTRMVDVRPVNAAKYWETLALTTRFLYDQKNNGTIIEDIVE